MNNGMEKRDNVLLSKSYSFSLEIIRLVFPIQENHREYILSKQLLRSGTAIGALSEEAQHAESKADFIHKLSIACKEARETHYWLRLLHDSGRFHQDFSQILTDCEELLKLLVAIIKTSKER